MDARIRKGIFWYTQESYERMRSIAADAGSFKPAFEKWEESVEAQLARSSGNSVEYVKIVADVEDFLSWCAERGQTLDSPARKAYADEVANDPALMITPDLE